MEVNETVRKFLEMLCLRVFIPVVFLLFRVERKYRSVAKKELIFKN